MRDEILTISTEQHDRTATIYVAGTLSIASALRLVRVCDGLPALIRVARIDLRSVHALEDGALTVLRTRLRHWRKNGGRIHLALPRDFHQPPAGDFRASTK